MSAAKNSVHPLVRQPYSRPDAKDYESPVKYVRAVQEWEHAQAVCGLRPLRPLPRERQRKHFVP